jgi:hypothetical protein
LCERAGGDCLGVGILAERKLLRGEVVPDLDVDTP